MQLPLLPSAQPSQALRASAATARSTIAQRLALTAQQLHAMPTADDDCAAKLHLPLLPSAQPSQGTQGFCNGKVLDTTKANGDCAASTCDTNTAADVTACCKDGPASGTAPSPSPGSSRTISQDRRTIPSGSRTIPRGSRTSSRDGRTICGSRTSSWDGHAHEHSHEDLSAGSTTSLSVLLAGALYLNLAAL